MGKTIEIEIVRPVNPAGFSFIRYVYGAMAARDRAVIDKHKKEFTRLVQRLGFTIDEKVGSGKLITGKIIMELDEDDKPVKAKVVELKIWEPTKEIKEEIEVSI